MAAMHRIALVLVLLTASAAAEPDPEHAAVVAYKAKDYPTFLTHMKTMYARDPSLPAVIYNLASAQALTGAADDAVKTLQTLAGTGLGFAIDKDEDFASLRTRKDFQAVVARLAKNRAPRGRAEPAFTLKEHDLIAEGVAYDATSKTWFVSSVRQRKILAVTATAQRDFASGGGLAGVLGISIDPARRVLWASSAALPQMTGYRPEDKGTSGVFAYDLATGKQIGAYVIPKDGKPHALGDVIVAANGDAYASDSEAATIYRVSGGALEAFFTGPFRSLQGLAFSADGKTLYLADYGLGLFALDMARKTLAHLAPAAGIVTAGSDGLYLRRGKLIATQNGVEPTRVMEFTIAGNRVTAQRVLLSGDPRAKDLALAAVVGDVLYLNAAAGWEHYNADGTAKPAPAAPHTFLKVPL